ncbi:hypothetical protein DL764_010195 [Monosporascus ibericus]|uniref:Transcription factor domain-containing protein n=1 Tax=Monosporascus ibericus TaxID=155417 RepID=A0A4Q4SVE5_9PEZI|nr:hypothetical protein DL764_010195 [Monosporascus ibericus]
MSCGARYLTLGETSFYHDEACQSLQLALNNSNEASLVCVATAVLLSSIEVRSGCTDTGHMERASTLIRKAGLKSNSSNLAGACFWSHALMQLTHSLYHNVALAWIPESPGDVASDADHKSSTGKALCDQEAFWARRMIYICTKIAALRAESANSLRNYSTDQLLADCEQYRTWCDEWANNVPRSMMPLCYIPASTEQPPKTTIPHVLLDYPRGVRI